MLQNCLADGCSWKMVLEKAVSHAGSFQGFAFAACEDNLLPCERKGCTSHYPLSFWMELSLDLWPKSRVLARGLARSMIIGGISKTVA